MLDGTTGTYGCTNFNTQRRPLRTGTSTSLATKPGGQWCSFPAAWSWGDWIPCLMRGILKSILKCSLKRKTCRYQTIGLNSGTLRCIVNSKRSIQGTERMCSIMGNKLSSLAHIDSVALLLGQSSSQMAHDTLACFVQDFDSIRIKLMQNSFRVCDNIFWHFYEPFNESIQTFSFICWYNGYKNSLKGIVIVCSKIIGDQQRDSCSLWEKQVAQ